MEMSIEDAENIVRQLQQAHRISVAFYRRILPTLDMIANKFGCSFFFWEPLLTSRPGRNKSQPSKSWAWDYVPLYASTHVYRYARGEKRTVPEDFAIQFDLYLDDNFSNEKYSAKGQPDAVDMPIGKALLKAYLFRPKKAVNESFDVLWEEEGENDPAIGAWSNVSKNWDGIAFEWPLSEVICNDQAVIKALNAHINLVTSSESIS